MFTVDEATAEAIRRAYDEGGELSGIVEFRRHFPLITDHAKAGECDEVRSVHVEKGVSARSAHGWGLAPHRHAAPQSCSRRARLAIGKSARNGGAGQWRTRG